MLLKSHMPDKDPFCQSSVQKNLRICFDSWAVLMTCYGLKLNSSVSFVFANIL